MSTILCDTLKENTKSTDLLIWFGNLFLKYNIPIPKTIAFVTNSVAHTPKLNGST